MCDELDCTEALIHRFCRESAAANDLQIDQTTHKNRDHDQGHNEHHARPAPMTGEGERGGATRRATCGWRPPRMPITGITIYVVVIVFIAISDRLTAWVAITARTYSGGIAHGATPGSIHGVH